MIGLLKEDEAGDLIGVTARCMQAWRCYGGGPAFVKISSKAVRYRVEDVEEWVKQRVANKPTRDRKGGVMDRPEPCQIIRSTVRK